jgi:hypothetical protein
MLLVANDDAAIPNQNDSRGGGHPFECWAAGRLPAGNWVIQVIHVFFMEPRARLGFRGYSPAPVMRVGE